MMAAQMIAALTILVTIHEFGHYIAARMFGVRVDKFFVFFDAWGKKLFSFKKGETEYGLGWLPLGGYVKIAGMIDESMDKEFLNSEPQSWEFRSKPAWQKLIIMLGGIILNIILGILIFTVLNLTDKEFISLDDVGTDYKISEYGEQVGLQQGDEIIGANGKEYNRLKDLNYALAFGGNLDVKRNGEIVQLPVPKDHFKAANSFFYLDGNLRVTGLSKEIPNAKEAGFQKGDEILAINGQKYTSFTEFTNLMDDSKTDNAEFTILRDGVTKTLTAYIPENAQIGIGIDNVINQKYKRSKIAFGQAINYGVKDAFNIVFINAKAFLKIGQGEIKAKDSLGGPIKIATMFGAKWDWTKFWAITGALSMVLAFMNALPVPALDGGHAMFAIWEMISGKPVSEKVLEVAQLFGFFLLMSLMVFIFWNDIRTVFFSNIMLFI